MYFNFLLPPQVSELFPLLRTAWKVNFTVFMNADLDVFIINSSLFELDVTPDKGCMLFQ